MALKNPSICPQWTVYVWDEGENEEGGYYADRYAIDSFDNEDEALDMYNRTNLGNGIVEVDLELDDGDDCFPVRHKDTMNGYTEYVY